jgi:ubiquinone/menaquinone biosynthesis C-methylase UbiE
MNSPQVYKKDLESKEVEKFLAKPDIHQKWERAYRVAENESFFDRAFDDIAHLVNAPRNSLLLDAGCGSCAHSVRLAKRGFQVQAVDFSESILKKAKLNIKARELQNRISIQKASILCLPFKDESFSYILCWGVLMHIPDVEQALLELARVLKPGGTLIISENNMYSLQSVMRFTLKRLLRLGTAHIKKNPAGIEYWYTGSDGMFLTRQTDIQWLIKQLKNSRFVVRKRIAGQFTDLYGVASSGILKKFIHAFNGFWFKHIKIPHPAAGNIVIVQKQS